MRKPQKPLPMDCCGSGCARCIYDIYEEHLARYNEWLDEQDTEEEKEI